VEHMRAAGLKWVKRQIRYGDGSGPGIISAAHGQSFKVLLSVVGEPSQVLGGGYFDQFASFVGGLAASGADAIEIWNEQNLDREWPNGQINPATYVQLLAKSFNAIKAANGITIASPHRWQFGSIYSILPVAMHTAGRSKPGPDKAPSHPRVFFPRKTSWVCDDRQTAARLVRLLFRPGIPQRQVPSRPANEFSHRSDRPFPPISATTSRSASPPSS